MINGIKVSVVGLFCVLAAALCLRESMAAPQDVPAEKVYKNIQVLKGIPASDVPKLMIEYDTALGVDCDYCHVSSQFEKTDKPPHKSALRDIQMTRDLNTRYQMTIDCMSCHHGAARPANVASGATTTQPVGTPATPSTPVADQPVKTTPPSTEKSPTTPVKPTPDRTAPETKAPEVKSADTGGGGAPPSKVSFKASYGAVAFDHDEHSGAFDCTICHHTNKDASETLQKCSVCHLKTPGSITKVTAKDVAHGTKTQRNCTGCHISSGQGPTKCSECHKR
jgi:hypothetical protein